MLAWLRDLTTRERRTMLACWGGWSLDGFDQQLYSYVVPTVIALWGMSTGAAGTIGTVTVVTSSFGGWFAGALADRFGRVRVLQIAIQVVWHPERLFIYEVSMAWWVVTGSGRLFVRAVSACPRIIPRTLKACSTFAVDPGVAPA
jgi:MFS family permease